MGHGGWTMFLVHLRVEGKDRRTSESREVHVLFTVMVVIHVEFPSRVTYGV